MAAQICAQFEIRKVEACELPWFFISPGVAPLILKDKKGHWLVDPLLLEIGVEAVLKKAMKDKQPIYELNEIMFVDLEWLSSDSWPDECLPLIRSSVPVDIPKWFYISMAEVTPSYTVEVKMIREVSGVNYYR